MKITILLNIGLMFLALSCQQSNSTQGGISQKDSIKIEVYDRLFNNSDDDKSSLAPDFLHRPVEAELADSCIKLYQRTFGYQSTSPAKFLKKNYTDYVSFKGDSLRIWLLNLDKRSYSELRMFFGMYTDTILRKYGKHDSLRGRVSIFIWPYKGRKPAQTLTSAKVQPYNLGDVHP